MIVILDRAPLEDEAASLVNSGCTKLLFPYVDEETVSLYAERLEAARELLVAAGVQFGVSNRVVAW